MFKYIKNIWLLLLAITSLFGPGIATANARYQENDQDNVFTFKELGYTERVMLGPYDTERLRFSLPSTWDLTTNSKITLRYQFNSNDFSDVSQEVTEGYSAGYLLVSLNETVIGTVLLEKNTPAVAEISIPAEALKPDLDDGRYNLKFFLDASYDCIQAGQSTLVISAASLFDFQHIEIPPGIDLKEFPKSIYRPDPIVPIGTVVVVPNQPSPMEMQAALSAVSGIGTVTNGEMNIPLLTVDKLTQEILSANNLIFIGKASNIPLVEDAGFPLPLSDNGIVITGALEDDGIIQMAQSPWNPTRVMYFVSGNTDIGVLKAGQTLGTGYIISSGRPDVSVIKSINPRAIPAIAVEDQTFADLGYENQSLGIGGTGFLTYSFFASAEQAVSSEGYLNLVVSRSNMVDYGKSNVSVYLNSNLIGTLDLSEQSEDQIVTTRLKFFSGLLQRGINYLDIASDLVPVDSCASEQLSGLGMTVIESSLIHLPVSLISNPVGSNPTLNEFPAMFLTQRDLSDLSFVLPSNDPVAWDYAARIAYYVGYRASVALPSLGVSFGDDVGQETRETKNIIIVGRASELPFVDELRDVMPAPFEAGSDEAIQPSMTVNYRLMPGVNVGYLQLFTSPWNSDNTILAVMANTPEGLPSAGNLLVQEEDIFTLGGDFSIVYGSQVVSTDTRLGLSGGGLASELPIVVTVTPSVNNNTGDIAGDSPAPSEIIERPTWIMPVILLLVLATIIISAVVVRSRFQSGSKKSVSEQSGKEK